MLTEFVTGFGHRPIANVATHTGAGVRKPPVKEGAGLGHPAQRALWGIGRHWACSRGPMQQALTPRMSEVGAMICQTSVENAGF
jgi:hypothetical protein